MHFSHIGKLRVENSVLLREIKNENTYVNIPEPSRHTMCGIACDVCSKNCESIVAYRVPFLHLVEIWCCSQCNERIGPDELTSYVINYNWNQLSFKEAFFGIDSSKCITVRRSSGLCESGWKVSHGSKHKDERMPPVIYDLKLRKIFINAFLGLHQKYIPLKSICALNPHWNDVQLDLGHSPLLLDKYKRYWNLRFIRSKHFTRTHLILMWVLPRELVRELSNY